MRIGIVAPSGPIDPETAQEVLALAARTCPETEIVFHPQCFLRWRHFAGTDEERAEAFLAVANDPAFDAIWFARGGYGSCRIAGAVVDRVNRVGLEKSYLGYSDAGYLLAALYRRGARQLDHGPMPQDLRRPEGERAIERALGWLVRRDRSALEPGLDAERPNAAFNLTVLGLLLGTEIEPDLGDHVLLLEEVSEHHYRIDRAMFHLTGNPIARRIAGLRLGRCSDIPDNDPPFGADEEAIARFWCERAGIPWLGRADIGHDAANRVVPFGRLADRC